MSGLEAEQFVRAGHIQATARLPVGLRFIPNKLAIEADFGGNELRQLTNSDLFAGPKVYRLGAIVTLSSQHDGLGGVFHIEEFPRRRPIAPESDLITPSLSRFHTLAD